MIRTAAPLALLALGLAVPPAAALSGSRACAAAITVPCPAW
jgi:hypothetical protein